MNPRFLLVGGPGVGKTLTARVLQQHGFQCMPDVARSIIQSRLSRGEIPRPEPRKFATQILLEEIKNYDSTSKSQSPVFFERGIPDALGMLSECAAIAEHRVEVELALRPCNENVFFFPFWPEIYAQDEERDQTPEQADFISRAVEKWYRKLGFTIIEMPRRSPEERCAFIVGFVDRLGRT